MSSTTDKVRVLRFLEYIGPRGEVENSLAHRGIKGERRVTTMTNGGWSKGENMVVREGFIGEFPERWEAQAEEPQQVYFRVVDIRDGEVMLETCSTNEVVSYLKAAAGRGMQCAVKTLWNDGSGKYVRAEQFGAK